MTELTHSIGEWGEELAVAHLRKLKYRILERNYHFSHAEIDIIAMEDDILVFIEVKTRHIRQQEVARVVRPAQMRRIAGAAGNYMDEIGHEWEIRFDLIEINYHDRKHYQLTHQRDFFYPRWEI